MKYLLDTNTCIAYLTRRSSNVLEHLKRASPADIALCSVVKSELLFGAHKSVKISENLSRLELFFRPFASLPFDDRASDIAAIARAALEKSGTPIGPNDLLIGAIALAHNLTLVTRNHREFSRIAGLRFEDWHE
jgi:tRNA(fMet)-specific endonuclease VapC